MINSYKHSNCANILGLLTDLIKSYNNNWVRHKTVFDNNSALAMSVVTHATAASVLPRRWSTSRISSVYNMFLT